MQACLSSSTSSGAFSFIVLIMAGKTNMAEIDLKQLIDPIDKSKANPDIKKARVANYINLVSREKLRTLLNDQLQLQTPESAIVVKLITRDMSILEDLSDQVQLQKSVTKSGKATKYRLAGLEASTGDESETEEVRVGLKTVKPGAQQWKDGLRYDVHFSVPGREGASVAKSEILGPLGWDSWKGVLGIFDTESFEKLWTAFFVEVFHEVFPDFTGEVFERSGYLSRKRKRASVQQEDGEGSKPGDGQDSEDDDVFPKENRFQLLKRELWWEKWSKIFDNPDKMWEAFDAGSFCIRIEDAKDASGLSNLWKIATGNTKSAPMELETVKRLQQAQAASNGLRFTETDAYKEWLSIHGVQGGQVEKVRYSGLLEKAVDFQKRRAGPTIDEFLNPRTFTMLSELAKLVPDFMAEKSRKYKEKHGKTDADVDEE